MRKTLVERIQEILKDRCMTTEEIKTELKSKSDKKSSSVTTQQIAQKLRKKQFVTVLHHTENRFNLWKNKEEE